MEKIVVEGKATKLNFILIISGLITIFFLIMGIDMANAGDSNTSLWFIIALACLVVTLIIYAAFSNCQITVTDKRIFGKVIFGRTIDLPLDSVSAIATTVITQGVSVSTSSGRITFFFLSNREEVANATRTLVIKRQEKSASTPIMQETSQSTADELKKFKELLDTGVITQEEFNSKKKQLLGL